MSLINKTDEYKHFMKLWDYSITKRFLNNRYNDDLSHTIERENYKDIF